MVETADILPSVQSDHLTLKLKFSPINEKSRGPSSWKFNNSLTTDKCLVDSMKSNIPTFYEESRELKYPVMRWEFLKYKVRQFTINYSKEKASETKARRISLEKTVKRLEISLSTNSNETLLEEYYKYKNELESICNFIAEGIILRSKASWHEHGEKSSKYFLNLEKRNKANCPDLANCLNTFFKLQIQHRNCFVVFGQLKANFELCFIVPKARRHDRQ